MQSRGSNWCAALVQGFEYKSPTWCYIEVREDSLALFRKVREHVLDIASVLIEDEWEWFGLHFADFQDPIEQQLARAVGEEEWSNTLLLTYLQSLATEHEKTLTRDGAAASILGKWHEELVWCFEWCEYHTGVHVALKGQLPRFAKALLSREAGRYEPSNQVTGSCAELLGKLAVFANLDDWHWRQPETFSAFHDLADDFNKQNDSR